VSENLPTPIAGAPAAHDIVEVIDRLASVRVTAVVESADDRVFVLRLAQATQVPDEAWVRWFDGATAWEAIAQLVHLDPVRVRCEVAAPHEWAPTPVRHSVRVPVDNHQLLVRIIASNVLARGRCIHAVCVDISQTGCRATWSGTPPRVGDAVQVAWDVGSGQTEAEVSWVSARVARMNSRAFGVRQVSFAFEPSDAAQRERIQVWHQNWMRRDRERATYLQAS
jgi:hypothetical protein